MKGLVDFGRVSDDYEQYRPGFPPSLYTELKERGWISSGQHALDLGTGTGYVAFDLVTQGLSVIGLDPSVELLNVARKRARNSASNLTLSFLEGTAEETGMKNASFDLVTAGQCWWWFRAEEVIAEARRVLKPSGRLLILCFSYLPTPGSVASRTEELILKYNPEWDMSGGCGIYPDVVRDLDFAGMCNVATFSYVETITFSHESWRGRIRACNGVGATMEEEKIMHFDKELQDVLAKEYPGALNVPHRVFVATGTV